jgi:deoxyribodipyrimidine photo-lyase
MGFIPELKNMPNKFLYKPWELETKYQEQIKVIIGVNYPKPIVDHAKARNAALDAFKTIKKN